MKPLDDDTYVSLARKDYVNRGLSNYLAKDIPDGLPNRCFNPHSLSARWQGGNQRQILHGSSRASGRLHANLELPSVLMEREVGSNMNRQGRR
jgi:hypothetical protein